MKVIVEDMHDVGGWNYTIYKCDDKVHPGKQIKELIEGSEFDYLELCGDEYDEIPEYDPEEWESIDDYYDLFYVVHMEIKDFYLTSYEYSVEEVIDIRR